LKNPAANPEGKRHEAFINLIKTPGNNISRLLCRELIRDENIKSTIRKYQIDTTALFVEFQRKLTADENYLIMLQNRSDILNKVYDRAKGFAAAEDN